MASPLTPYILAFPLYNAAENSCTAQRMHAALWMAALISHVPEAVHKQHRLLSPRTRTPALHTEQAGMRHHPACSFGTASTWSGQPSPPSTENAWEHDGKDRRKLRIERHARPRRASVTAPLRGGTNKCKAGSDAGRSDEEKTQPNCIRSSRVLTEDERTRWDGE